MKKGIILIIGIILSGSALIAQSGPIQTAELVSPLKEQVLFRQAAPTFQKITVEKIWKDYEFSGASVSGFRSMKDGNYFSKITKNKGQKSITKHKFSDYSGAGEVLVSADLLKNIKMNDYSFNSDETKALLSTKKVSIYRRSYTAIYYLLDLKTKELQPLDETRQPQMLAQYSPDGSKVSYVYKNNLYVKDIASGKVKQLTKDGETKTIQNIYTFSQTAADLYGANIF